MPRLVRVHLIVQSETAGFSESSWLHAQETKQAIARGIQPLLKQILGETAALEDVLIRPIFADSASLYGSLANPQEHHDEMDGDDALNPVSYDHLIALIEQYCADICTDLQPTYGSNPFVTQSIQDSRTGKALQRLFTLAYADVVVTASEVEAVVGYIMSRRIIAIFAAQAPMDAMSPHDFWATPLGKVINSARRRAYRHEAWLTLSEAARQSGVNRALLYEAITYRHVLPLLVGGNFMFPYSLVEQLADIIFL